MDVLFVALLVNVTNLLLWMMDEKQTCPDSVSLLSSLLWSTVKKPACRLKDIMSVCGQGQLCLHVYVCACEAADTRTRTQRTGLGFTGLSGCVLVFVCWNVTPDSLRKSSG